MRDVYKETRLTYWKLFGSPEFQFSKVSGLPVDIQKNLQHADFVRILKTRVAQVMSKQK